MQQQFLTKWFGDKDGNIDRHMLEYVAKTDLNILSENIGKNND